MLVKGRQGHKDGGESGESTGWEEKRAMVVVLVYQKHVSR